MSEKLSKIYNIYDNTPLFRILYIIILSVPPAIIFVLQTDSNYQDLIKNAAFLSFINPKNPIVVGMAYAWVPALTSFMHILGVVAKKDYYFLNKQGYITLMDCIDQVVHKKSNNIAINIKEHLKNKDKKLVIEEIINPTEQIEKLIDQLYIYLNTIFDKFDPHIKITLMEVVKVKKTYRLKKYAVYTPENEFPHIEIEKLNKNNSCAKESLRHNKMVIIENSQSKKGKRIFTKTDNCKDCDGCNILTYPIYDPTLDKIYFILNISHKFSNNKNVIFKNKFKGKQKYEKIFQRFTDRLLLESRKEFMLKTKWRDNEQ